MPREESHYPQDWLKVADKDWRRMGQALDDGDPEEAGFWLQQALEKFLKAYLLSKGWTLRKIHDLMESALLTVDDVSRSRDEVTGLVEAIRQELR